jgi:hypothetical protein
MSIFDADLERRLLTNWNASYLRFFVRRRICSQNFEKNVFEHIWIAPYYLETILALKICFVVPQNFCWESFLPISFKEFKGNFHLTISNKNRSNKIIRTKSFEQNLSNKIFRAKSCDADPLQLLNLMYVLFCLLLSCIQTFAEFRVKRFH